MIRQIITKIKIKYKGLSQVPLDKVQKIINHMSYDNGWYHSSSKRTVMIGSKRAQFIWLFHDVRDGCIYCQGLLDKSVITKKNPKYFQLVQKMNTIIYSRYYQKLQQQRKDQQQKKKRADQFYDAFFKHVQEQKLKRAAQ